MRQRYPALIGLLLTASTLGNARAQSLGPLDLEHAMAYGLSHHPAVQSETAVEAVRAARATVERARVFADVVKVLVDKELRPGVEYSRAAAELALASTQLIRAEQAEAVSRAELARTLGAAGQKIEIVPGRFAELRAA